MTTFLSKKQVRERISLSFAQIDRLEKAGKFPIRIRISPNRVVWIEIEVEEWMQKRVSFNRLTP